MTDRRIIKAELQNLQKILEAKADMCIGAGKMKMLSFANACSGALELLKEQEDQEYVEPIPTPTDSSGWFFKCNKCSNPINFKDKFCSMCGQAVKWE